eukprot:12924947-Alexandrium_andersonii.AAC.1
MSASLVGSEMCIRDSGNSAADWAAGAAAGPLGDSQRMHVQCQSKRGAVSYTHLTLPTICSV